MTDKQIKNYFNMTALGFLAYAVLLQILAVIVVVLLGIAFPNMSSDSMYYSMMVTVVPCMLFLHFLFRNSNLPSLSVNPVNIEETGSDSMDLEEKSFSPLVFLHYFLIFCGVQWISSLLTMPLVFLFQKIGMDLSYSEMAAKGGALDNIPMLIYTVLFAPL